MLPVRDLNGERSCPEFGKDVVYGAGVACCLVYRTANIDHQVVLPATHARIVIVELAFDKIRIKIGTIERICTSHCSPVLR